MGGLRKFLVQGIWLGTGIAFAITACAVALRQTNIDGWKSLIVLALLSVLGAFLARLLSHKILLPASRRMSIWQRVFAVLLAAVFSLWLTVAIPLRSEWIAFLFPKHELIISPIPQDGSNESISRLWVEYLSDGNRYRVPLHQFQGEGWQRSDEGWISSAGKTGSLRWNGRLLHRGYLVFRGGPEGGKALVQWDGQSREVNLYASEVSQVLVKLENPQPFSKPLSWLAFGAYWVALTWSLLSLVGYAFLHRQYPWLQPAAFHPWFGYSIPPFLTGLIYWLAFYPAILSEDSIDQWRQVLTGQFNDWAPAIYTLLTAGMAKLWNSPASMTLLQIFAFSLLIGWGVGQLRSLGLPAGMGWGMSILLALVPANPVFAITHWKDIPYSYGLAGLFLLCLLIAETEGKWLTEKRHGLGLSLMATVVFLFRHNGVAIFALVLIVLLLLYRNYWKTIGFAALVGLGIGLGVRGPLYNVFQVERNSYVLGDTIFLHHFGAHITAGTPLTDEEKAYFNALMPLDSWPYYCCNVSPIYFTDRFNHELFAQNHSRHLSMFIQLALRNPRVELQHWACSSGLVWQVCVECTTLYHNIEITDGTPRWINDNPFGVKEQPVLPHLTLPLAQFLIWSSTNGAGFLWSAGGAFYLFLIIWGMASLQRRSLKWAITVGVIPILQSLIMLLVSISSDFRYQYGVFLIALFSLSLLWIGKK